jgi:hypothetical protein
MDERERERIKQRIRQAMSAPPAPPLEATRRFLQSFCSDEDSLESVRLRVHEMAAINARSLEAGLAGIEGLLQHPHAEAGVLARLVAYDAGWVLEHSSDDAAKEWLAQVAQLLREELGGKS